MGNVSAHEAQNAAGDVRASERMPRPPSLHGKLCDYSYKGQLAILEICGLQDGLGSFPYDRVEAGAVCLRP